MIGKRKDWNSGGVSDIIGNILILAITVVLFGTIFVFVQQMPVPKNETYVDFDVKMEVNQTTGTYNILNITHVGGEELKDFETNIYLTVDNRTHALPFSASLTPLGDTWSTGETALFDCSPAKIGGADIVNATKVSVMIINSNEIAWQGDVKNIGNSAPVIMDRWVDSDPSTPEKEAVMTDDDFSVFAKIKDTDGDLNTSMVFVNMSSLGLGVVRMSPMFASSGDTLITFIANSTTPADIPIGYYYFIINATDKAGHETTARLEAAIGGNIGTSPNLVITSDNIWVDPSNPTRGDDGVRVYVKIINYGKVSTTFTTHVYDTKPNGTEVELGNVSSTIPAGGPETIYLDWPSSLLEPSGNHTVTATAELPPGVIDADPSDNTGSTYIQVMPKILVVDDDGSSLGSDSDTSSMILAALDAGDFRYDRFVVSGVNGPAYDTGLNRMEDYDIIIWDTGHETSSTLTATDEANLQTFMTNGGNLWLMGEDILNDVGTDSFMKDYIHVSGFDKDSGPDAVLNGSAGSCLNGTNNVTTIERNNIPNSGDIISYSTDPGDGAGPAMEGSSGNDAIWYDDVDRNSRRIFFPFELASVEEPALQAEITYKVLYWLGNISYRQGRDLSISEQTVSPTRPFYAQPVTISAVVRNNGMLPEPTVEVAFWIDGQSNGTIKDTNVLQPGESWRVNYTWVPRTVGTHSIVAEVDPYNLIEETNENNNRVSSYLASTEIYIQYRILVVDDDGSENNPGGSATRTNVTAYACDALDSLGYEYELYVVPEGGGEDGPASSTMDDYNAVLWFTGDENSTITSNDQENLSAYLDGGGFLWLDSQSLMNDIGTSNTFVNNYLKVNGTTLDSGVPGNIYGTRGDAVTHGMNMVFDHVINDATDSLISGGGGINILWRDSARTSSIGVRYEDTAAGSKTLFTSVDISGINGTYVNNTFTNGSITREYLTYMIMHWFDMPDERVEVMAASSDIYISDSHPQLGESYVIRATVHNVGGTRTSALIRFMDGDTLVGSDSVYLAPDGTTTAEVVWTPLFAGQRTITVQIDPIYEIPNEVFRFNDNPYVSQYVYFFWDDMENGSSKWQHESTIMLLNGENALDYFDKSTQLYTNIIQDWNDTVSEGLEKTTQFYNSFDSSYLLRENSSTGTPVMTTTQTIPLDVIFVLDSSGSMAWDDKGKNVGADDPSSRWYNARVATINFIENFTEKDRASIWTFDGHGHPNHLDSLAYMTDANKLKFMDDLNNSVNVNGGTPIYDTIGDGINDDLTNTGDPDAGNNDRLDFVVALTDGADTASGTYSADREWGNNGLLNAPPMVYTIGVVDTKDLHTSGDTYPTAGDDPNWQPYYDTSTGTTNEYALWHTANSSLCPPGKYGRDFNQSDYGYHAISDFYPNLFSKPNPHIGHYYFAESASQIGDIFLQIREIAQSIASGGGSAASGNVTRSADFIVNNAQEDTRSAPPGPTAQATTVFYADFETTSGDNAWTHGGTNDEWQRGDADTYHYHSASNCWGTDISAGFWGWGDDDYKNNANEYLTSPSIDLTTSSSAALTFWRVYKFHDANDFGYAEISTDGGSTWTTLKTYTGSDTTWRADAINITSYVGNTVQIQFRLKSDGSGTDDGLYVDDVEIDTGSPSINATYPHSGSTALPSQYVAVVFDISMDTNREPTLTQTGGADPGNWTFEGWFSTHKINDTAIWSHDNWTGGDTVTLEVSDYKDIGGLSGDPYSWSFDVLAFSSSSGGGLPQGDNTNKSAVTQSMDLSQAEKATLTFWHKFNIVPGMNGAVLEIGYKDSSPGVVVDANGWAWKYITPSQGAYNGNMNLNVQRLDSFNNSMVWAWNGISGKGEFSWQPVTVNLLNYVPDGYRDAVRVKFQYFQYGMGTGYGWYLDDVKVAISRDDTANVTSSSKDAWQLSTNDSWSGAHSWWNVNPATGYCMPGIDNSLMTMPINLINARNATLSAYFKFNLNTQEGAPPDGFRVEVSSDNGLTWHAINLGVRSSWGVSGTDNNGTTSYTGHNAGRNWTEAGTLTRLNCDLSDWSGNVILIRFRMVTTNATNYDHYESDSVNFGGFYIDDVVVSGETVHT